MDYNFTPDEYGKYEKLFPGQQPNEKIKIAVREHWFLMAVKFFIIFLLSLLPWIFKLLIVGTSVLNTSNTAMAIVNTIIGVYYLGLLVALFVIYVIYYLNIYVVSEDRIVDIDQNGILFRQVSELNIETVEDVSSQKKGILGNLLDYGTVYVQTAGAQEKFEFDNIPHPDRVSTIILELYEQHSRKIGADNQEQPKP